VRNIFLLGKKTDYIQSSKEQPSVSSHYCAGKQLTDCSLEITGNEHTPSTNIHFVKWSITRFC